MQSWTNYLRAFPSDRFLVLHSLKQHLLRKITKCNAMFGTHYFQSSSEILSQFSACSFFFHCSLPLDIRYVHFPHTLLPRTRVAVLQLWTDILDTMIVERKERSIPPGTNLPGTRIYSSKGLKSNADSALYLTMVSSSQQCHVCKPAYSC